MKLSYHPLSLLFIAMVVATACSPEEVDSAGLVRERYLDRVAQLQSNLERDCQKDVLEEASQRADSLLIDRARRMRRIEGRPPRPSRPGAPPIKELSAPLPLRPLFPFEIRFDTLLRDSLFQDSLRIDSIDQGLLPEMLLDTLPEGS